MKNWFKQNRLVPEKKEVPETPYMRAKMEWDERIGSARVQAKNWRFIALISMLVSFIVLLIALVSLSLKQNNVYVAQVSSEGRVINVSPLQVQYSPTVAQKQYFVTNFIKMIRELPLDPVVAKKNWTQAYNYLTQRSSSELNTMFQKDNPAAKLGKQTITVEINDINPVSDSTYQVDWTESSVDSSGKKISDTPFSGVFSIIIKQPTTQEQILQNPLGIYIANFHVSSREN